MGEPFQRASSRMRRWNERRSLRSDPLRMSIERVFERRRDWLRGNPDQNLSETVNTTLTETLPAGWWQDPSFWEGFSRLYPEQTKRLVSEAESIVAGKLKLFQWKEIELSKPIRWSATLEPGRPEAEWPQIYCADIDVYHDPTRPERDVKWCWELNRFQHLLCLGAAWRLTRKESFAREARDHLESWMDSVRYPLGVQWNSNLEVGLRLLAWVRCHILCANSAAWDDRFVTRFITCVYIHARHLARELTVHHAPGNHLLGEAAALFYVSTLYPLFTDSAKWRKTAVRILDRLVPVIILQDGVYAEQSTGYFRFVAEFLLPVIHLAKHHGITFSEQVFQRLAAGLEFIQAVSKDSGEVPMIGDSDTGRAVGWPLSDFWDFSWLVAAGAALLDRPSLCNGTQRGKEEKCGGTRFLQKGATRTANNALEGPRGLPKANGFKMHCWPHAQWTRTPSGKNSYMAGSNIDTGLGATIEDFPAESFLLLGEEGLESFAKYKSGRVSTGNDGQSSGDLLEFADGGYQISRDGRFSILFDAGPLGIPPGSGHGHADGLSFLLWYKGQSVITDTGTGLYNGSPLWRNYFRSTAAHNTVRIDGENQSRPLDTFRWAELLRIKREDPKIGDSWRILRGVLDWGGVKHYRFIIHLLGSGLLILDYIDGSGEHDLDWSIHFDPVWNIDEIGAGSFSAWTLNERLEVTIRQSCEADYSILRGSMNPVGGWNSRYYGFRIPSMTLRATMRCRLPANILVKFTAPGQDIQVPDDLTEELFPPGILDWVADLQLRGEEKVVAPEGPTNGSHG